MSDPLMNFDGLEGEDLQARLDQIVGKAQRRLDEILYKQKYEALLGFVKKITKRSCCNLCHCIPCDAVHILRSINEKPNNNE